MWDMDALKKIVRKLLDMDTADVLASGLKIFIPVLWWLFPCFYQMLKFNSLKLFNKPKHHSVAQCYTVVVVVVVVCM